MAKHRLLALFALLAALALLAVACADSEDTAERSTTTTVEDAGTSEPDVTAPGESTSTTVDPEAEAADHTAYCEVFVELDERFSTAEGTEEDLVELVAGMKRLADAAPEYLAADAELVAAETEQVVQRARDEGVDMNSVDPSWFSEGYNEASEAVFSTGYERCGLVEEMAPPEPEELPAG